MDAKEIGIFETKARLSEIVQRVIRGECFYITRRGRRVAELRPVPRERLPLERGCARNAAYSMTDDFDAPLEVLGEYM